MKKIPYTLFAVAAVAIMAALFAFVVPQGENLISRNGDFALGVIIGGFAAICIIADLRKYRNKKIPDTELG